LNVEIGTDPFVGRDDRSGVLQRRSDDDAIGRVRMKLTGELRTSHGYRRLERRQLDSRESERNVDLLLNRRSSRMRRFATSIATSQTLIAETSARSA